MGSPVNAEKFLLEKIVNCSDFLRTIPAVTKHSALADSLRDFATSEHLPLFVDWFKSQVAPKIGIPNPGNLERVANELLIGHQLLPADLTEPQKKRFCDYINCFFDVVPKVYVDNKISPQ